MSITECIEFYRLAFVPGLRAYVPTMDTMALCRTGNRQMGLRMILRSPRTAFQRAISNVSIEIDFGKFGPSGYSLFSSKNWAGYSGLETRQIGLRRSIYYDHHDFTAQYRTFRSKHFEHFDKFGRSDYSSFSPKI